MESDLLHVPLLLEHQTAMHIRPPARYLAAEGLPGRFLLRHCQNTVVHLVPAVLELALEIAIEKEPVDHTDWQVLKD